MDTIRRSAPWTDNSYLDTHAPALRVSHANNWYFIHGRGGYIVGSTQSLEELISLIHMESERGYGAVEYYLRGEPAYGCHGLGAGASARPKPKTSVSLEDLGL